MLQAVETATQVQPVPVLNDFRELPIYALQESPNNPRSSFDEGKLFELAQSIRSQGGWFADRPRTGFGPLRGCGRSAPLPGCSIG